MVTNQNFKQTEIGLIPDDWEISKISEFSEIKTGTKNTQDKIDNGAFPFFVRSQTIERINSFSFHGEAILTAGDGVGVGKVFHYYNGKFDFHQRVYAIVNIRKNIYGFYFFKYFQNNFFQRISQMTAKSSVDSVRFDTIANMYIPLPPLPEQQAIAEALSDTDSWIESLEKLIAKKRLIKQGAMQKLLTPQPDWEILPLKNHVWYQEGPGVRNYQFTTNGVKLLNGKNIEKGHLLLNKTERFISESEAYGIYKHFLIDDGDILIACSGVTIDKFDEKVTIANNEDLPLCMNTSTMRFKIITKVLSKYYFFHFLKSDLFKDQVFGKATGSAQLNFGPSHIKLIDLKKPKSIERQTEIATILSDMDAEIEALEQKLIKAQQIKQGMMQELLTGRIRLV